jgi:hypothetical protein
MKYCPSVVSLKHPGFQGVGNGDRSELDAGTWDMMLLDATVVRLAFTGVDGGLALYVGNARVRPLMR